MQACNLRKGGRDAKDHVQRNVETCGDRGLERRLCHVRVKGIHELEDMINDIIKSEERGTFREWYTYPPRSRGVYPSKNHGSSRRLDER
ncbi:hypothetical protein PF005_g10311 [Phytophthora fragariae]|nr:hypothetical protein PF011_g9973 [Phytophthora fragariae]KAE9072044.1 hypothetical protein PF010_g25642 [Phytophthora fragariae]KAE9088725.1 hypothetical protein PF006_g25515 [Phytophthora fragariae]KAE9110920.1 hypothetical protein PF007_g11682 [Phytophthora fragariae]KAE9213147.1 hypothetical protein PF005_g10311 [Phytophthora fragariae]